MRKHHRHMRQKSYLHSLMNNSKSQYYALLKIIISSSGGVDDYIETASESTIET